MEIETEPSVEIGLFYVVLFEDLCTFFPSDLANVVISFFQQFKHDSLLKHIQPLYASDDLTYQDVPTYYRLVSFDGQNVKARPYIMEWDHSPTNPYPNGLPEKWGDALIWAKCLDFLALLSDFDEDEVEIISDDEGEDIFFGQEVYSAESHCCHWCGDEKYFHSEKGCECVQRSVGQSAAKEFEEKATVTKYGHKAPSGLVTSLSKVAFMTANQDEVKKGLMQRCPCIKYFFSHFYLLGMNIAIGN